MRQRPPPARQALLVVILLLLAWPGALNGAKASKGKANRKKSRIAGGSGCPGLDAQGLGNHDRLLHRAAELSQARALDGAQACLETALSIAGNEHTKAHVLFNLAVIARQRGDIEGAKKILLEAPKEGTRGWVQAHTFLGILQLESGESRKALTSLTRAKKLAPREPAIYRDMAQGYYNLGEAHEAVHVWEEGVVNMPTNSEGFFNLGLLQRELGGTNAERCYQTAVRLLPHSARYRYSYGNLLYDRERLVAAANAYAAALRLEPTHEDALNNLGNALRQLGRLNDARRVFESGLKHNPINTNLLLNAGQIYQDLGLLSETSKVADKAYHLNPALLEASILRGSVAYGRGELQEAIDHYRVAIRIDPTAQQPLLNLANTLGDLYRSKEARVANQNVQARTEMLALQRESIGVYERMLQLRPDDAEAFLNMFWARKYACDWANWESNMQRLYDMVRQQLNSGKAPSLKPFLALAFPISAALYLEIASAHAAEEAKKAASLSAVLGRLSHSLQPLPPPPGARGHRLRLAYVSTDLGDHPVGHQAWFHHHRANLFDVMLLALSHDDGSEWWQRTKGMVPHGNFHELGKLGRDIPASDFAKMVNGLGVHVLITLNGWTSGHQLDAFALRPAPLQVEYMGSHDSTGAAFVQLFVSDRVASPPEFSGMYSEKLLVTPDSFFINEYRNSRGHVPALADAVYSGQPPPSSVSDSGSGWASDLGHVSRGEYGLPRDGIIMCNFNQLFKVDPLVFAAWMNLLERVPSAYLWLLRLPSTAEEALRAEAARYGAAVSSRLLFSDRIGWKNHLIVKSLANISLDNPVFNSHTSGVDILWAGVPLLTLPRETMSSRVAASLLYALPFPPLITRTLSDYQEIAARLIGQRRHSWLHRWRRAIQEARNADAAPAAGGPGARDLGARGGSVFDSARLVAHLEEGLLMAFTVLSSGGGPGEEAEGGVGAHVVVSRSVA